MSQIFTTRRRFLAQSAAAVAAPAMLAGQASDRPPNILSIVCDQMRGDAMGFLGHPNVRTPSIDRLASEGVVFERCFVNNPVCLPSRKSAFSGRYPHEHGSLSNLQPPPPLPWPGTLLEHMSGCGYRTGWVGKNHTYNNEAITRTDFRSVRDREPFRAYNGMVPPHWHTDVYWPEEDCYPEINTREALRFLDESKSADPFFLHVSYFDPHPPYMAPAEYSSHYRASDMKLPDYVPPGDLSPRLEEYKRGFGMDRVTEADLTETMRYYYAQIEWGVDKQVGRLLRALQERGLAENTLVVFTSDHGDFMGTNGLVRKGMFLYDSLLHVPMIWRFPGRAPAGTRNRVQAQHIDLFPTFADYTGRKPSVELPGRSLRAFVEGGRDDDAQRPIFTSAGYGELGAEQLNLPLNPKKADAVPRHTQVMNRNMTVEHRTSMIRTPEWKLVMTESRGPELYYMDGGVVEQRNVADKTEHAGVRAGLEKQLTGWWKW
jgi:arylsulfatase A-like enzyme